MKINKYIITGILIKVIITLSLAADEQDVKHVSSSEFKKIIESEEGYLVDIRTPGEYKMGHIKGAVMIDFYAPAYKTKLNELEKDKAIYIYCRSGNRSSKSIALLLELGFKEIINLQRGIIDWQRSGYKLEQ